MYGKGITHHRSTAIQEQACRMVQNFRLMHMGEPAVPETHNKSATPVRFRHPYFNVAAAPRNSCLVYDTKLVSSLLQPPPNTPCSVAIVSQISVSRKGGFSCPVRTGAVLGCLHVEQPGNLMSPECSLSEVPNLDQSAPLRLASQSAGAAQGDSVQKALESLIPEDASQLRNCKTYADVEEKVAKKTLPPIAKYHLHRSGSHFCGVTIEFEAPGEVAAQVCSITATTVSVICCTFSGQHLNFSACSLSSHACSALLCSRN